MYDHRQTIVQLPAQWASHLAYLMGYYGGQGKTQKVYQLGGIKISILITVTKDLPWTLYLLYSNSEVGVNSTSPNVTGCLSS